jgi:adenylate cyclase
VRSLIDRALAIGILPGDTAEQVVVKRVGTGAIYALIGFGLTWLATGWVPFRLGSLIISTIFLVGNVLTLVVFARTRQFERAVRWTLIIGLASCSVGQLVLGGYAGSSGAVFWGIIAPIGAELFFGPERASRWFAVDLALIAVVTALDPWARQFAVTPYDLSLTFFLINTVGPASIGFLMIRYVDRQRREAQARSEELLLNVLPAPIAERLKAGEQTIAQQHAAVSVLFADVVDFTPYAEATPPAEVLELLNHVFSEFDEIAVRRGMEKIKTIGDAYMAVAGLPDPLPDHARCAVEVALEMLARVHRYSGERRRRLDLRVGIASGPVVAGVIGRRKFSYDLWGDTVNTASRMESTGIAGCIQVTQATRDLLGDAYPWKRRDGVEVKGKGTMTTFVLVAPTLGAGGSDVA